MARITFAVAFGHGLPIRVLSGGSRGPGLALTHVDPHAGLPHGFFPVETGTVTCRAPAASGPVGAQCLNTTTLGASTAGDPVHSPPGEPEWAHAAFPKAAGTGLHSRRDGAQAGHAPSALERSTPRPLAAAASTQPGAGRPRCRVPWGPFWSHQTSSQPTSLQEDSPTVVLRERTAASGSACTHSRIFP